MAFVSTPGSTNEVNTANVQVSTASTPVSTASTQVSTANLSDDIVYAFFASQPNRSQLVYEDLEQIHDNDLEEMDLKWQLALLSMRARRFYQRTGKRITINGSDTAGYDKSKVECFNYHKMEHFARECRGSSSKAMVAIDGAGFDWSFMVDEEFLPTWLLWLSQTRRDITYKDSDISVLKCELEKLKKEEESNQIKMDNFENASKSLDKLIGSQISDNNRKGLGFESYNVVPPPPTGLFAPPTIDLSNSGLKEFQQLEFERYGFKTNKSICENFSNEIKKTTDAPIIKDWVSDCDEDEAEVMVLKSDNVQHKPEQANQPKKTITVDTVNDGEQQLIVIVDGQTISITEAYVRRHLQLADANGISSLPNTEIFDQLTPMGYVSNDDKLTFQKGVHIPLFDTMLIHDQPGQGEGPTLFVESQHTPIASPSTSQPTTSQPMTSQEQPSQVPITKPITDSFTTSHPTQTPSPMPHDSPLSGGHTHGSDEGSKKLNELIELCTKLSDKVTRLEDDLK
ncbi:hypothetical protein Tco_0779677 [Tanacetum coccineum]